VACKRATLLGNRELQLSVTSGSRSMVARLSSVVRCVYWRETAALSCPTISRAIKSETSAAFSLVTALCRKLWNEVSLASRACARPFLVVLYFTRFNEAGFNENFPKVVG
jgi:hypothetical protein